MAYNVPFNPYDFNPRSPWGSDAFCHPLDASTRQFQSTLPVGERRIKYRFISSHQPNFNPRSPWGSDCCSHSFRLLDKNFNPRSPWGSDLVPEHIIITYIISIHAPRGGATSETLSSIVPSGHFNPRSPWGSDIV